MAGVHMKDIQGNMLYVCKSVSMTARRLKEYNFKRKLNIYKLNGVY